jgi:hypothetical protein
MAEIGGYDTKAPVESTYNGISAAMPVTMVTHSPRTIVMVSFSKMENLGILVLM